MSMRDVTDATFEQDVLKAESPVVVDFWAPWCGPCRVVTPILDDLASKHGDRVSFVKMNVDENPQVAARYTILSIPTVILFEGGEAKQTVVGARSKSHYEGAMSPWLQAA